MIGEKELKIGSALMTKSEILVGLLITISERIYNPQIARFLSTQSNDYE
jgi:hypothetical protein